MGRGTNPAARANAISTNSRRECICPASSPRPVRNTSDGSSAKAAVSSSIPTGTLPPNNAVRKTIPRAVALSASRSQAVTAAAHFTRRYRPGGTGVESVRIQKRLDFSLHWFHWKNSSATPRSGRRRDR
ncbi:MAG: hypothetical protein ACLVAW_12600 [Eisenbergiella massiliensis]